jgi:hypothetical protein
MTDTTTRPFRCPIGRSRVYQTFHWQKNTNGQVVHECSGCSVLFKDPDHFTRFELFEGSICRTQLQASLTALSAARRARQAARLCPQISSRVDGLWSAKMQSVGPEAVRFRECGMIGGC